MCIILQDDDVYHPERAVERFNRDRSCQKGMYRNQVFFLTRYESTKGFYIMFHQVRTQLRRTAREALVDIMTIIDYALEIHKQVSIQEKEDSS